MAKKPTKYPRKLRQTIERIAANRDERQAQDLEETGPIGHPFQILWETFFLKDSVNLLSTRLDEVRLRMTNRIMIEPQFHHPRLIVEPPWIKTSEGDGSE